MRWHHWILWWKIDPVKLNRQAVDYASLGVIDSARGIGLLLALLNACAVLACGGMNFWGILGHEDAEFYAGLIEAAAFLMLGCLVFRGYRQADLAMMAFYTIDRITGHVIAHSSRSYQQHAALWVCVGLLAWAICMHAYYFAYRVEEKWNANAKPASR